jgi:Uma2 family endonuclease
MNQPAQSIVREEPARFTVAEFSAIASAIDSAELPDQLELIDGVITRMPPPQRPHGHWLSRLHLLLGTAVTGSGNKTLLETGLTVGRDTLRQPDLLLVRDDGEDVGYVQPSDIILAVEVAHTTLGLDLGPRKFRFAQSRIPLYWVVDVEGQRVHRFAEPCDGDYAEHVEQGFDEPLPVPGTSKTIQLT